MRLGLSEFFAIEVRRAMGLICFLPDFYIMDIAHPLIRFFARMLENTNFKPHAQAQKGLKN
ncbi:hypothetical protein Nos7107_2092 [Nostoc sp. PCC 7107]|nr:hypothetical protein Nos7107_2092 [Nostoc sp. PCC 7107]